MQIDTNITHYTILESKAVIDALQKLNKSGRRILFVVNELNIIKGVFADGDFVELEIFRHFFCGHDLGQNRISRQKAFFICVGKGW